MPSESDLRKMLGETDAPSARIDVAKVIRGSRARRLPRQLAVGGVSTLAVLGIGFLGVSALQPQQASDSSVSTLYAPEAGSGASDNDSTTNDSIKRAPADKINLCTGPVSDVAPSVTGLQLDAEFASPIAAGTAPVDGSVRLTNLGATRVTGSIGAAPAVTVSQGGIVLWHSNGPTIDLAQVVDLAPGQSIELAASIVPVRCGVADDELESFRADLPALPAGDYQLSVAMDFLPDVSVTPTPGVDLVTGPAQTVTIQ
ncbi:MAG: hypothetical protein ABJB03_00790 [Rhodoglobus sp.]